MKPAPDNKSEDRRVGLWRVLLISVFTPPVPIALVMWHVEAARGSEVYSNLLRERPDLFLKVWAIWSLLAFAVGAYYRFKNQRI